MVDHLIDNLNDLDLPGLPVTNTCENITLPQTSFAGGNYDITGRERLIRSHSSARFCFELSGNSN